MGIEDFLMLGLRDSAENTVLSIDRYNANTITFVYGTLKVETFFNRSLPGWLLIFLLLTLLRLNSCSSD